MLALVRSSEFYGTVGTKTIAKCGTVQICIGDVVEFEDKDGRKFTGLVVIGRRRASVFGTDGAPIEDLKITKIVGSHADLKEGELIALEPLFEAVKIKGLAE